MNFDVKDVSLAEKGKLRLEWALQSMPVLQSIGKRFSEQKPLKGKRIAACLHVTTETAALALTLKAGGAEVFLCASNPLSTQDDVAAALAHLENISVFAIKGEDTETYYRHIDAVLDARPDITMDDGADLVSTLHKQRPSQTAQILGGTEETTTGVIRLRSMAQQGILKYPIIAVNDAHTKHLFDNRYGTGQSTVDGIIRATNRLLAGSVFVVCGYGWCGRGVAMRARGIGRILSPQVYAQVQPLPEAAKVADFFVTVTGNVHVIREEHFLSMKDGAIVANSGHFNVEIDIPALERIATGRRQIREFVEEFTLPSGRHVNLLAEGRLVNLAAAEGHPSSVMDMSFANQALSAEYVVQSHKTLTPEVYPVPQEIDREISSLKLHTLGIRIDTLSPEQEKYLASWEMGT